MVSRIRTPKHVPVPVPRTWECVTLRGKGRLSLQNQVADPYTDYAGGSNGITRVLRRGRGQHDMRRCHPLAMKLGGASRGAKTLHTPWLSPGETKFGLQHNTFISFWAALFTLVCYSSTLGKEYTPLLFYPLPSTNSCHAWRQRNHCTKSNQTNRVLPRLAGKTRGGQEESMAGHWDLTEKMAKEDRENSRQNEMRFLMDRILWNLPVGDFFFFNHRHTKTHIWPLLER